MLRMLITVVIVLVAFTALRRLTGYYSDVKSKQNTGSQVAEQPAAPAAPGQLPGLPPQFEESLQAAQSMGATGMKRWLDSYRKFVTDPRLAVIELDYAQMISRDDPREARRIFADVRNRLPANSPLQARLKQMERAYQ